MRYTPTHLGLVLFTTLLLTTQATAEKVAPAEEPPQPDPKWTALEVVEFQLDGLQHDGDPKHPDALRTVWDFASPQNQEKTGPFENFAAMVRGEPYAAMIGHRNHTIVQDRPLDHADIPTMMVVVRFVPAEGDPVFFAWIVAKQVDEAVKDCWMTEAVYQVEPPADKPRQVV